MKYNTLRNTFIGSLNLLCTYLSIVNDTNNNKKWERKQNCYCCILFKLIYIVILRSQTSGTHSHAQRTWKVEGVGIMLFKHLFFSGHVKLFYVCSFVFFFSKDWLMIRDSTSYISCSIQQTCKIWIDSESKDRSCIFLNYFSM